MHVRTSMSSSEIEDSGTRRKMAWRRRFSRKRGARLVFMEAWMAKRLLYSSSKAGSLS